MICDGQAVEKVIDLANLAQQTETPYPAFFSYCSGAALARVVQERRLRSFQSQVNEAFLDRYRMLRWEMITRLAPHWVAEQVDLARLARFAPHHQIW